MCVCVYVCQSRHPSQRSSVHLPPPLKKIPYERRITGHEKRIVAARQAWRCALCEHVLEATFQVDHVVPLHSGGDDDYQTNCHALCVGCHAEKTQREEIERLARRRSARGSRPPLECTRCGHVVSPYFAHRC